jgi:RES domain-containing protein
MAERRARDIDLLDALDAQAGVSFEGNVWRVVRAERNVLEASAAKARWDPGTFDVLYTSLERDGALEEIHFHLSCQPVFPSKMESVLHRIAVRTTQTLKLADAAALAALGIAPERYGDFSYERSREIGDAAFFLGFDGIMAPSARWTCHNLVLFTDRLEPGDLVVVESEPVDWGLWRSLRNNRRHKKE